MTDGLGFRDSFVALKPSLQGGEGGLGFRV